MVVNGIGASKEVVIIFLATARIPYRIMYENGKHKVLTRDFMEDRVNLIINDGVVTAVNFG